ncbi:dystroglycan-like [Dorcoceras hygrometricum]|uniref:Dystroglycan-like n=1 Tax=Dorcoceras hygrometricum TaxID=472368 RepID=A0A2Z7BLA3_9LAMI|nr:dystroglycan-like [Dorcoceras hygrometricum]
MLISSGLLVQSDEGVSDLVVDRIGVTTAIYREEPECRLLFFRIDRIPVFCFSFFRCLAGGRIRIPNTKSWADSDSETSSTSSSSSDSEQEEVHCFMADQTDDDEVFDFANSEFTREDLVQALNDMVHEYKTLSHTFEEIKAENASLKNSSAESSSDELEDTDSLNTELSRLKIEIDLLRNEASELKAEVDKLTEEMSSWNKANHSLYKLYESQKPLNDKTGVGFNYDSSLGDTSTQSQPVHDKLHKRIFVSAGVIHDCLESMRYNDQDTSQPDHKGKGKVAIGYQRPENSKPGWLKNKLNEDKAKAGISNIYSNLLRNRNLCLLLLLHSLRFCRHFLHSQMASAFITYSYQINFESVLMIHDHEGMLNMFNALEASGLRKFLGCESILYENELGDFFDTALIQGEDITGVISGKFVTISPTLFSTVFDLPTEGITDFSEVPKDKVYDARSLFSQKGLQIDVHGKKKFMKHEFRLLNDILAKAITVKTGSFDSVTVEQFQMMTAIQYGLKVNWGKVLFDVLKDMVDRTQNKAKGFAVQIGVLLKSFPAIPMGDGVPFPSAKVLSMRTVHTYIVTNTTIDARSESEEPGMAKTPKGMKKLSSADEMPVDMFAEFTASKKRSATEADAPIITKKRRTGKSKPSVSQAKLDIVQVATDVEQIQIVDPTHVAGTDISKEGDAVVAISTVEADIAKVLEETLALGVTETEQESQVFDEALFEEDFTRWLDDFVARHNEPELGGTHNEAQAAGSIHSVADKEVNMPIDDLLIQICDDLLLPVTAAEVTMLRLGAFSSSGDKGKAKLGEDDQVTDNAARKLFALICRDVESQLYARYGLIERSERKERLMLAWAETTTLAVVVRRQLYVLIKYRELLLRTILESYQRYLTHDLPWNAMAIQVANLLSVAHSNSIEELKAQQKELNIDLVQSHSSLPAMDYIDSGDVRLAHFYSIANSSCWVRPVFLINGVWTPAQGPEFWSSSCNLSLFLDNLQMPEPAIQKLFVPLISFIEPDQYWATVPWLMRIWRWTKVCEEIAQFNVAGGLRPVRKDACYAITVHNLGVERIPANFLRLFAQGLACNNFVDSVVKKDLGDTEEVVLTGVDSLEHDLRFALGPAIFSHVEQEERLYFVQSPDSPPTVSPHHASSSSSTDVQSSLSQRIHDSNCEMISKLNSVELGVRGDLLKMQSLLRQSFETACRVLERQSNTHTAQITDLKKGLLGPVGIIFGDLIEIKKKQREQDAKQQSMDEQIAAIRNEHLEFQSKIAADMLSLSTQVGDIADFLRSGVAKKGVVGSSSRPTTVRAQTQTLPPTTGTFEERVAQARRHIIETGQVISVEEAAARVIENDRRESERLERERRDRRQSRSGTYKIIR